MHFRYRKNFCIFLLIFIIRTYEWNEIFKFQLMSSKRSCLDLSEPALFKIKTKLDLFAFFSKCLPKYSDFVNSYDYIGKISSISIFSSNLMKKLFYGPMKMNFYVKTLDLCCILWQFFLVACNFARFSGLVNSNYWKQIFVRILWRNCFFFPNFISFISMQ